jgi:phosphate transport system protein
MSLSNTVTYHPKFDYLKRNLSNMAELVLEQVLMLSDSLDQDNYELADRIIERDDELDRLEKENDTISQNAILEAVATRREMGIESLGPDRVLIRDPLRFALSAIRITRNLERLGDNVVNAAQCFRNGLIHRGAFHDNELLCLIQSRMITVVGMAVESLVEEKNRFFGSIQAVDQELDELCERAFRQFVDDATLTRREFADLYRIILSLERAGDLAVNVGEELVRLSTGEDVRHMDNDSL